MHAYIATTRGFAFHQYHAAGMVIRHHHFSSPTVPSVMCFVNPHGVSFIQHHHNGPHELHHCRLVLIIFIIVTSSITHVPSVIH